VPAQKEDHRMGRGPLKKRFGLRGSEPKSVKARDPKVRPLTKKRKNRKEKQEKGPASRRKYIPASQKKEKKIVTRPSIEDGGTG